MRKEPLTSLTTMWLAGSTFRILRSSLDPELQASRLTAPIRYGKLMFRTTQWVRGESFSTTKNLRWDQSLLNLSGRISIWRIPARNSRARVPPELQWPAIACCFEQTVKWPRERTVRWAHPLPAWRQRCGIRALSPDTFIAAVCSAAVKPWYDHFCRGSTGCGNGRECWRKQGRRRPRCETWDKPGF